ncbi:MAG: ABC transporter ATP-binding protein, partial [Gammaproteobacteria bacterium]|nr:ABC transporter ATP-binding protein [Gammaproteobacteria bacterium]
DEPTANLDSVSATHLMDLFRELNQKHGVTFLIATHDERVMAYALRLIRMQDGKVISDVLNLSN